ncbi:hypothetical protein LTR10_018353 [Elasticomyces elasticus]|uniref:3-hydroxyisobutyrate dehydrogenase n=1 Tax=Exophiala sideris TaxID=1016849 RepID=A0ABR0J071_9EURO|nr:hypothetical protein LTR10_018353 [Elasticomyces elasticus]KAK5023204.1 hypothetical protein LTS07_009426 [Exophiala sideris]KAK5028576.1 hypothetical protein LTR13_009027 [Exophiala sideris]KAK5052954.1 hypothetical protein LTR69_009523 [Exophiala sideris]KAK5178694.1 hypothetical protein LTR44_008808 [Eurotiomycetes sp. CCFEE 6388]
MATDIGFIGIGNMGFSMAGNVRKKMASAATLHIFDVNSAACQHFVDEFGSLGRIKVTNSAKQVASDSTTVISMVPMDQHARAVYLEEENGVIAAPADANRLILECSTISVATAREIGEKILAAGKGTYVDTPVSGGVVGAQAATLSFFCGYSPTTNNDTLTQRVRDIVAWMGHPDKINFCGHLGSGLVCKLVNNYIGLSNIVVAAQGMAFGIKHGIDKGILWKCIKGSSGDSWVMDSAQPVPGIIETSPSSNGFKAGFTPTLCAKDISLGLKAAHEVGIDASMGEAALKLWSKAARDPRTSVITPGPMPVPECSC